MEHRLDIDPLLRIYCEKWSSTENAVLREIERHTHLHTVKRHDASDMIQGRLISFISKILAPKLILEIGTFTAYATGCLAEGLAPRGRMISIENDLRRRSMIENNLNRLDLVDTVEVIFGDALQIIPELADDLDLVFIDAAKYEYKAYYEAVVDKVRQGGIIIADNTLWKGRVLNSIMDRMTQSMHEFNQWINADDRVEVVLLPYRDGISLIRKV